MLEKFLTTPEEEFRPLLQSDPAAVEDGERKREAYRYSKVGRSV